MFTMEKWLNRSRIESTEGFSIALGRDKLVYREDGRSMQITVDVGAGQVNVFVDSIGRWDDDPMNSEVEEIKQKITSKIKSALEWR